MGAKMGLKIAFNIFDKNRNGLIDEDDLIQLISLSRTLPML
jgi:Ca2+-binding EF-hand superfamily protein